MDKLKRWHASTRELLQLIEHALLMLNLCPIGRIHALHGAWGLLGLGLMIDLGRISNSRGVFGFGHF
jgi:hypothetical protein